MDKPIPAVIKTSIDTRHPSRAVATVERDVYGGDGRTVVIERGSTLVGQVASVGEASEEKIAVA
ncbi:TrbI/VirB10 family protein, partial [Stenotrophomonas maltophilia]